MSGPSKPSESAHCLQREELNILWSNILEVEVEPEDIQTMVLELYLKYYHFGKDNIPLNYRRELDLIK